MTTREIQAWKCDQCGQEVEYGKGTIVFGVRRPGWCHLVMRGCHAADKNREYDFCSRACLAEFVNTLE